MLARCKFTVDKCSFQLMRVTLASYRKNLDTLSTKRSQLKQELGELSTQEDFRKFSALVHTLNQDLYNELSEIKARKLKNILPKVPNVDMNRRVVKIPENLPLSSDEEELLQKGLSFVPLSGKVDAYATLDDAENLYRKIRLKSFFGDNPDESNMVGGSLEETEERTDDGFSKYLEKLNRFTPKAGEYEAVDTFIKNCRKEVKKLNVMKPIKERNISATEQKAIESLQKRTDIVIKPADKGGAVCVWRKDLYIEEGMKQLNDDKFYKHLEHDNTPTIQKKIEKEIGKMIENGELPESAKSLIQKIPRCGVFYLLPKIHKQNVPGRPVVSNVSCPTYTISKFLSSFFKPIVQQSSSFIKDTTHLLQKLENFEFKEESPNNQLFTMDVKGLYTNIPNGDGLQALKYHLENRQGPQKISTATILRLAELVLQENCFEFNSEYYQQISGTMMGTPFGVEYSCSFMIYVETRFFEQYDDEKPLIYGRYIDDIIGVSDMGEEKLKKMIEALSHFHPALEYTTQIDQRIPMLDVDISIKGKKVSTTLYTKDTDSHSYLQYSSSHPSACKKGIPYSQFLRVRRICSEKEEFEKQSKFLLNCFLKQGYPRYLLEKQRRKALLLDRKELLKFVAKDTDEKERIIFPIRYHPTNVKVVNIIKRNFTLLKNDEEVGDLFKDPPMVAYRRDRNLKDLFVRSKLKDNNSKRGTTKCKDSRCLTCNYVCDKSLVIGPRGSFEIRQEFDCNSKGLIYCIECNKCGELYVGETARKLKERFREHRRDVLNRKLEKEVGSHFNSEGHSEQDMRIFGLKFETNLIMRKLWEQKVIGMLGCVLGTGGMNTDFRFPQLVE